ncbi:hypothetical protein TNCV_460891 [Trichonephila clavipes]|nr:hypothetical protein TNCV_460891 [Trichonephila clavipes]
MHEQQNVQIASKDDDSLNDCAGALTSGILIFGWQRINSEVKGSPFVSFSYKEGLGLGSKGQLTFLVCGGVVFSCKKITLGDELTFFDTGRAASSYKVTLSSIGSLTLNLLEAHTWGISSQSMGSLTSIYTWYEFHINIAGNKIAEVLAKHGATQPSDSLTPLTCRTVFPSRGNDHSTFPCVHRWYQSKCPAGSLSLRCSKQEKTAITRFRNGHLRAFIYNNKEKYFRTCARRSAYLASPEYILDCLDLTLQGLYEYPLMVIDFLRVNDVKDLV